MGIKLHSSFCLNDKISIGFLVNTEAKKNEISIPVAQTRTRLKL